MTEKYLKPKQALNPAFHKVKPDRSAIESIKANLIQLIDRLNEFESEEFDKNLASDSAKSSVGTIFDLNNQYITVTTSTLEAEIDQLVYGLYGLSEEEIGIVERI